MKIDWKYLQEKWDWAGHIAEAAVLTLALGVALALTLFTLKIALTVAGAFAVGSFFGREKRDYENSVDMPPPHLESYKFWKWTKDGKTDFFPVLVAYAILIVVLVIL